MNACGLDNASSISDAPAMRSQPMRPLLVVVLLMVTSTVPAAAEQRPKILFALPAVDPNVPQQTATLIEAAVVDAVRKAGAEPLGADEAAAAMKKANVASLARRKDSFAVAEKAGAAAVLRYEARMKGEELALRTAVYLTAAGKAALLEQTTELARMTTTIDEMVAELLLGLAPAEEKPTSDKKDKAGAAQEPSAAGAPSTGGMATAAQPAAATTPIKIFSEPNPRAASGMAFGLQFGGAAPIGGFSEQLAFGFRLGGTVGYEIRLGRFQALVPQLQLAFSRWAFTDDTIFRDTLGNFVPIEGSLLTFAALVGGAYHLYLGPVDLWTALRFGFGYGSATATNKQDASDSLDDSGGGFAIDWGIGAHYMFVPQFGAGLVLGVGRAFVGKLIGTDMGAGGFNFGLSLKAKLPH